MLFEIAQSHIQSYTATVGFHFLKNEVKLLHTDMDSSPKYIHKRKLIGWEEGK